MDRIDLAEDRTVLANERTFAAWFRTALASLAVGVAFERLFAPSNPTWIAKAGASALLAAAILMFAFSIYSYMRSRRQLERHRIVRAPLLVPSIMVGLGTLSSLVALGIVWFL